MGFEPADGDQTTNKRHPFQAISGTESRDKHCKAGGWSGLVCQMDILAPVFAYLTAVAGIVGAFLVAFSVVVSAPKQPAIEQHSAAIVSATAPKIAAADLKPSI